jgi:putative phosphoserine phosphatase/1-acylglycerol-3-phosphate O-acyltransferase
MEDAAFFDLDRTLLTGASGPMFSTMLKRVGLLPDRSIPGEGLVFKFFDVVGETIPSMLATRQMARAASGWDRSLVQEAGQLAAERLIDEVPGFAKGLIAKHHEEGRKVIMATTSPYDLVKPLADALGIDDVIATRYGEEDGRYNGSIDGLFVWGPGKLAAVKTWAQEHAVDVASSYAYSDSVYDVPLLSAVKFPTAVNPDPRLRLVAMVRRWPSQYFDVPAGVPKLVGVEPQRAIQFLARPQLFPWVRFDVEGVENIPTEGPVILVGNHRSYFDPLAIGWTMAQAGRAVRFLGKKEVFDAPIVGQVVTALGGIRVERGSGSDEPLKAAAEALAAGEAVGLFPEGRITRDPQHWPERSKTGAVRLAIRTGAPVVPVALVGAQHVVGSTGIVGRLLRNTLLRPRVAVAVGEPIDVRLLAGVSDGDVPDDATVRRVADEVMAVLVGQVAELRGEPAPHPYGVPSSTTSA